MRGAVSLGGMTRRRGNLSPSEKRKGSWHCAGRKDSRLDGASVAKKKRSVNHGSGEREKKQKREEKKKLFECEELSQHNGKKRYRKSTVEAGGDLNSQENPY